MTNGFERALSDAERRACHDSSTLTINAIWIAKVPDRTSLRLGGDVIPLPLKRPSVICRASRALNRNETLESDGRTFDDTDDDAIFSSCAWRT